VCAGREPRWEVADNEQPEGKELQLQGAVAPDFLKGQTRGQLKSHCLEAHVAQELEDSPDEPAKDDDENERDEQQSPPRASQLTFRAELVGLMPGKRNGCHIAHQFEARPSL
jgi:hypothetical protein